jgi:hypothetical protein
MQCVACCGFSLISISQQGVTHKDDILVPEIPKKSLNQQ